MNSAASAARMRVIGGKPLVGLRVLSVEDNPYGRIVHSAVLRELGHTVSFVGSGEAAVETVARNKHDVVLISPWLLHRHEKLWRDPNAFVPERFMPPAPPPDRFAYLPFGVGARVCIGAHFALVEATLALAKLIGAFKVDLIDKAPVMPVGVVTTQPDSSPMFRITPR